MTDNLLELAIATTGGRELRKTLRGLRIDISIGGPIWAMKGWPPEKTFDQILTLDTVEEHMRLCGCPSGTAWPSTVTSSRARAPAHLAVRRRQHD